MFYISAIQNLLIEQKSNSSVSLRFWLARLFLFTLIIVTRKRRYFVGIVGVLRILGIVDKNV